MPTRQAKAYSNDILLSSAARTAAGDSGAWDGFADVANMSLLLDVTASAGTSPTVQVVVEHTYDGTTWYQLGSFNGATNITAIGKYILDIGQNMPTAAPAAVTAAASGQNHTKGSANAVIADSVRIRWGAFGGTGTPGYTFSVRAISQTPQT